MIDRMSKQISVKQDIDLKELFDELNSDIDYNEATKSITQIINICSGQPYLEKIKSK